MLNKKITRTSAAVVGTALAATGASALISGAVAGATESPFNVKDVTVAASQDASHDPLHIDSTTLSKTNKESQDVPTTVEDIHKLTPTKDHTETIKGNFHFTVDGSAKKGDTVTVDFKTDSVPKTELNVPPLNKDDVSVSVKDDKVIVLTVERDLQGVGFDGSFTAEGTLTSPEAAQGFAVSPAPSVTPIAMQAEGDSNNDPNECTDGSNTDINCGETPNPDDPNDEDATPGESSTTSTTTSTSTSTSSSVPSSTTSSSTTPTNDTGGSSSTTVTSTVNNVSDEGGFTDGSKQHNPKWNRSGGGESVSVSGEDDAKGPSVNTGGAAEAQSLFAKLAKLFS